MSRGSKRRRSSHTWPYGRDNGKTRTHSTIDNSTCAIVVLSVVNIQDSCQCRLCSHPASSRPGPADRYAPSGLPFPPLHGGSLPLVKPRTATPVHRPQTAVPQGNTSLQDRRVLPQGQAAATPAWTGGVDRCRILTLMEGATLATSSNLRKPECPGRHFLAHLQTRKRVSGRFLV